MESTTISIRAHHLLCIQGFQKYGYSDEFVENMENVIGCLSDPQTAVRIITACDVLCFSCPHHYDGICTKSNHLSKVDYKVLDVTGLKENVIMKAKEAISLVNAKFDSISAVESVCSGCDWKEKCLWYLGANKTEIENSHQQYPIIRKI